VVLIVNEYNEISDMVMYALGLKDSEEITKIMQAAAKGERYETKTLSYTYDQLLAMTYKLVLACDYYEYNSTTGTWVDKSESEKYMRSLINNGEDIKIVGIVRPNEDAVSTAMTGAVGYHSSLTKYVIDRTNNSKIVKQQLANKKVDVFTGAKFGSGSGYTKDITIDDVNAYIASLDEQTQAQIAAYTVNMTEEEIIEMFSQQLAPKTTDATYEDNLSLLGVCDLDNPSRINIYASTFEDKDAISELIENYNKQKKEEGREDLLIEYTDFVALLMSSISTIINFISYGLIAFVSIALVVSSIMIGIITYISVLERTKEIGILRSIGASKKDISRVFNAETLIVGFISGVLGIGITLLLIFPINLILEHLADVSNIAKLPTAGGIILVIISMVLTLIAGLIPSRVAAKKDPVEALRTE
ncbi:MAG: ABC transporter permease, partial [Clostridia bacterium]|nr:ABC transporter permease [Clostridia bacterium]